jgi:hypothetical protein
MVYRCAEKGDGSGSAAGAPEWLKIIREANEFASEGDNLFFGAPKIEDWWAGGTVEEYPDARFIFGGDGTCRVCAKTVRGREVLLQAMSNLGYRECYT